MWKFIKGGNTVSFFVTGCVRFYNTASVTVYKHCFILCNWIWKILKDVYTISYFVTGGRSL